MNKIAKSPGRFADRTIRAACSGSQSSNIPGERKVCESELLDGMPFRDGDMNLRAQTWQEVPNLRTQEEEYFKTMFMNLKMNPLICREQVLVFQGKAGSVTIEPHAI